VLTCSCCRDPHPGAKKSWERRFEGFTSYGARKSDWSSEQEEGPNCGSPGGGGRELQELGLLLSSPRRLCSAHAKAGRGGPATCTPHGGRATCESSPASGLESRLSSVVVWPRTCARPGSGSTACCTWFRSFGFWFSFRGSRQAASPRGGTGRAVLCRAVLPLVLEP